MLQIIQDDAYLQPYEEQLNQRVSRFQNRLKQIQDKYRHLQNFASQHHELGFQINDQQLIYREWAPNAQKLELIGDFNQWKGTPLKQEDHGIWACHIPLKDFPQQSAHLTKLKTRVIDSQGNQLDRLPAFTPFTEQNPETNDFCAKLWFPTEKYQWQNPKPSLKGPPLIYECHIGMAQEAPKVGSYQEFRKLTLPHIHQMGYNAIQMMGIMEHPYYGSFGYQVSNFFAPSSRFGTPDDLRELIDDAHGRGIAVYLDLVHSHAIKNIHEGLNRFDGTEYQYFHAGARGNHDLWDSKCFDYGKEEVQRFLLSNLQYWQEDFQFDGFRFDGVTSMLYEHHGCFKTFEKYDDYFNAAADLDAILYLQLANQLIHSNDPKAITIAEDMSGMPGMATPIKDGGIGFDYRLHMGVPDLWIKTVKEKKDEEWPIGQFYHELTTGRPNEKKICYLESHDQALVGDKTLAFWLMDSDMYYHMAKDHSHLSIDRGLSLLKCMKAVTIFLGGEGYLNFMGNEFAHPEWIDFPREGNGYNYHHARRQWSLLADKSLKYHYIGDWERTILEAVHQYPQLLLTKPLLINEDPDNLCIQFAKGPFIFAINFHPHKSIPNYTFGVPAAGKYQIILNSDGAKFGGFNRIDESVASFTQNQPMHQMQHAIQVYLPNRTAIIWKKEE